MKFSRRDFLASASAATASLLPLASWAELDRPGRQEGSGFCALLDLNRNCSLPESLAGYEMALNELGVDFRRAHPGSDFSARTIIVAGAAALDESLAQRLMERVGQGANLLLESGAGFAGTSEVMAHREALGRYFGLTVGAPVELWSGAVRSGNGFLTPPGHVTLRRESQELPCGEPEHRRNPSVNISDRRMEEGLRNQNPGRRGRVPYVDFVWPLETKIRDFSRATPLLPQRGKVIAWAGNHPVALERKAGRGRLIFLGSPLGPALLSGDREARLLLERFISAA